MSLRIAGAVTLLAAGCAIAIMGTRTQHNEKRISLFRGDPDRFSENSIMRPGRNEAGPEAAEAERYALRAFPADYVPFELTRMANQSWNSFQSESNRVMAINASGPLLNWSLFGPSVANFPNVLTFSGASYVTSGRVTGLAVDTATCNASFCRVWVAAAGGGIWRSDNVLDATPSWTFVSGSFATNAIGTITFQGGVLYVGTGEPNTSGDSEAGFGIYKSTDGGTTWTHLAANTTVAAGAGVDCTAVVGSGGVLASPAYSGPAFDARAISQIVVDPGNPNIMYVGSARGVRGVSSTTVGSNSFAPGMPPYGLWKSTDAGATFTLLNAQDICLSPTTPGNGGIIASSFGSTRGVHAVALDPNSSAVVYAAPFPQNNAPPVSTKGGVWRSIDSGGTWTQMKNARNATQSTDRASFAVTPITGGKTRMYVGVGNNLSSAANQARVYRVDDAVAATDASFTDLTALQEASAATKQTLNYCGYSAGAQCSYDNVVYTPVGKPDVVYIGGVYDYDQYGVRNNGRAFLRSTDAGVTFTDQTWDATDSGTPANTCCQNNAIAPNGMHPDQHAVIELPGSDKAIYGSDGGLMRSSGVFTDISAQCDNLSRNFGAPLSAANLATCKQLLKSVPSVLTSLNVGLSTLQFQSVSIATDSNTKLFGGTQDNGTFTGNGPTFTQVYFGDGGNGGISSTNSALSVNTFTGNAHAANFGNGDPLRSYLISGPILAAEAALFYPPIIADPSTSAGQTIFEGSTSVWRTQDWGGSEATLQAGSCQIFQNNPLTCGDFLQIGPAGATSLVASNADYRGTTRSGGAVGFLARTPTDTGTLWASTTGGRLFISKNADAAAALVTFVRLDSLDATTPTRAITGIFVDRANANHAWVTYNSYNTLTPGFSGHVFSVVFNPVGPSATFTNLDGAGATAFPDFPALAVAVSPTGDVYAATDYNVLRLPKGSAAWEVSGTGLPMVTVSGLSVSSDNKKLYAATHGRSVFVADLPAAPNVTTMTTQASQNITLGSGTISDTATLAGGTAPTGTITFKLYGPNDGSCAGAVIFTSVVTVAGNGSYTSASYTPTAAGTYRWIATYSGDNTNAGVTTACNDANESAVVAPTPTPTPTPTATPTPTPTPTPFPASQTINVSTRMRVDAGDNNAGIGGFIITGSGSKHVIVRSIGPSLTKFGFAASDVLADPKLELHGPGSFATITNNNWRDTQEALIKADGLAPTNDLESAIDANLPAGAYTAIVRGNTGTPPAGIALFEVYDLDTGAVSKLANLSTRAFVGTGNNVVIAGFVLGNNQGIDRIGVRGLGPSLAAFGVTSTLADPTLELRDENGTLLLANNDWQDDPTQAGQVTTAGIAPTNTKESAMVVNLPPGLYTAILAGLNNSQGVGTVEVYDRVP